MGAATTAEIKRNWFIKRFRLAKERGMSISRLKLVADFCITFNTPDRTAKEFLNHFRDSGIIKIWEDEIIFKNEIYDKIMDEITGEVRDMSEKEKNALRMS